MITVDILSPESSSRMEVDAIFLPGVLGEFEVLRNHAPIVSVLTRGSIRWRAGETTGSMPIEGGVVRLKNNEMQICVKA